MKKRLLQLVGILFSWSIIFNPLLTSAQENEETELFLADSWRRNYTIPFQFINNLIVIPVQFNNTDTLRFILDTGVKTALITELAFTDSIALEAAEKVQVYGLGGDESIEALHSENNTMQIGAINGRNIEVNVILEDIFHLSEKLGTQVHGLIGYDVFKDFVIEVDYVKESLTFYKPEKFRYPRIGRWQKIPIEINRKKPYIESFIVLNSGKKIKGKLLIDSGSSDALWLFQTTDKRIDVPEKHINSFLGCGLGGDIHGKRGKIKSLKIGKFQLEEPVTAFPDSLPAMIVTALKNRSGTIGGETLRRFKIIFDYPNQQIALKPNKYYKKPFHYNLSGMEISNPSPGLPVYLISSIRENSPADRAGLKIGDQIVRVNYLPAYEYSFNDLFMFFTNPDGKKIKIHVLRNGEKVKTSFVLEDNL